MNGIVFFHSWFPSLTSHKKCQSINMYSQDQKLLERINYFKVLESIKSQMVDESDKIDSLCQMVVNHEPFDNETTGTADKVSKYYLQVVVSRTTYPPDYNSIFREYLSKLKDTITPENYVKFLRFLSVYFTGKIPVATFISLFIPFLPSENKSEDPLFKYLPIFLSAIDQAGFINIKTNLKSEIEIASTELLLNISASASSSPISASISKCMKLLANGLISLEVAKEWMSKFVDQQILDKLSEISDFSYCHPSRFPHELILFPEYSDKEPPQSVAQKFMNYQNSLHDFVSLRPVVLEVISLKLRGLRKVIRRLCEGAQPTNEEIYFAFGEEVDFFASQCPKYSSVLIYKFSKMYIEYFNLLKKLIESNIKHFKPNHPEYRCLYKSFIKKDVFAFHYSLVGQTTLDFGSSQNAFVTYALVNMFIKTFGAKKQILEESLNVISPIFKDESKTYVVTEQHINALAYMCEIARLLKETGKTDEVKIDHVTYSDWDPTLIKENQKTEFGEKIASIMDNYHSSPLNRVYQPDAKLNEVGDVLLHEGDKKELSELFPEEAIQHLDLPLVRVARALSLFDDRMDLPIFPQRINEVFLLLTIKPFVEAERFTIVITNNVSPVFFDFTTSSSEAESPE